MHFILFHPLLQKKLHNLLKCFLPSAAYIIRAVSLGTFSTFDGIFTISFTSGFFVSFRKVPLVTANNRKVGPNRRKRNPGKQFPSFQRDLFPLSIYHYFFFGNYVL